MMKRQAKWAGQTLAILVGSLTVFSAGCQPATTGTLGEFVRDFLLNLTAALLF
ncbi:MAG: hypothetical protein AMXMBFR13_26130 [Phycisphaerae bacterium]